MFFPHRQILGRAGRSKELENFLITPTSLVTISVTTNKYSLNSCQSTVYLLVGC